MQGYNCIVVYNQEMTKLLFCKRVKDPYKGLYNLVGGKIENGEDGFAAAYRELEEETGIRREHILLYHMMDFTYYNQDCYVEVYVGTLNGVVKLSEEVHPLSWLNVTENFYSMEKFAGEGNIGHIVENIKCYGVGTKQEHTSKEGESTSDLLGNESFCIGVESCRAGWITAVIKDGGLTIERFNTIDSIVAAHPKFDEMIVDMVIGLQSRMEHIRPDSFAQKLLEDGESVILYTPCRQAVYAENISIAYTENKRILNRRITPQAISMIQKIRDIDTFLQENAQFKNQIKESNPEVCFAMLHGKTVVSKKNSTEGIKERMAIVKNYIPELKFNDVVAMAGKYVCSVDDIISAICLAITANMAAQGKYELLPSKPMKDETGLLMQMVLPRP